MSEGSILYDGGKKPGSCPKGWMGKVVRVLHCKAGGSTDGAKHIILLRQVEEEWNYIVFKTWVWLSLG